MTVTLNMGLGTDGEERLILQKLEDLWPKALPRRTVKGGGKVERRELVFPLLGRVKRFLVSDLLRTYPIGIGSFFFKGPFMAPRYIVILNRLDYRNITVE